MNADEQIMNKIQAAFSCNLTNSPENCRRKAKNPAPGFYAVLIDKIQEVCYNDYN